MDERIADLQLKLNSRLKKVVQTSENAQISSSPRSRTSLLDPKELHPSLKKLEGSNEIANPYLTHHQSTKKSQRGELKLCKPGTFIEQANTQRKQKQLEQLQHKVDQKTFESGLTSQIIKDLVETGAEQVPIVEWWDAQFVSSYEEIEICFDSIGGLIYRPALISGLPETKEFVAPSALKLTKEEIKRKRKLERQERDREKRENIEAGKILPDKPKIKLTSMMRVLGNQAIQDPTQLEAQIRAGIEERRLGHELSNHERKLTPQEASAKKRLKYDEDLREEINCAVYRIVGKGTFLNQWKFKVEVNARQNHLCGKLLQLFESQDSFTCFVVAEGGPKGLARYKRLLENRINWNSHAGKQGNFEEPTAQCQLLWEGTLKEASIHASNTREGIQRKDSFQTHEFTSKFELKKYLESNNFNSYIKFIFE